MVLRKLTRKSLLKFGKYAEYRVGDLLKLCRHDYLRWVYYNSSNINFFDDILDELNITKEFIIVKPGKNSELHKKILQEKLILWTEFTDQEKGMNRKITIAENKRIKKAKKIMTWNSNMGRLKNQGHTVSRFNK